MVDMAAMDGGEISIIAPTADPWNSLGKAFSGFCKTNDEPDNSDPKTESSVKSTSTENDKLIGDERKEKATNVTGNDRPKENSSKSSIQSRIAFFDSPKEKDESAKAEPLPRRIIIANPYRTGNTTVSPSSSTKEGDKNDEANRTSSGVPNEVFRTRQVSSVSLQTMQEEETDSSLLTPRQSTPTAARTIAPSTVTPTTRLLSQLKRLINHDSWSFDAFLVLLIIVMGFVTMYNLGYKISFSIDVKITDPSDLPTHYDLSGAFPSSKKQPAAEL